MDQLAKIKRVIDLLREADLLQLECVNEQDVSQELGEIVAFFEDVLAAKLEGV